MSDPDEAELAAHRLEVALDRIARGHAKAEQEAAEQDAAAPPRIDPRLAAKLDNLIRALRTALDN